MSPISLAVVRSKNFCGLTVIGGEQSAQPFATLDRAFALVAVTRMREAEDVPLALLVSLGVVMWLILF